MDDLDQEAMRVSLQDGAAFAAVFERHHSAIWGYMARSAGRQVADELASEVFLIAFRRRASFDGQRGTVRSWLYGIATNLLRERSRRAARGRRAVTRLAGRREADGRALAVDEVSGHTGRLEASDVVGCLDALNAREREVLVLFAWERLSYEEIAVALGVPVGTVRSRLSRARARLRGAMELAGLIDQLPVNATHHGVAADRQGSN